MLSLLVLILFCRFLPYAEYQCDTYPTVLLSLPLRGVLVHMGARSTVGKLEETGKHVVDLCSVRKNGILEVDSVRDDVIILIHPKKRSRCDCKNS